jgi:hypothetical protein
VPIYRNWNFEYDCLPLSYNKEPWKEAEATDTLTKQQNGTPTLNSRLFWTSSHLILLPKAELVCTISQAIRIEEKWERSVYEPDLQRKMTERW